MSGPVITIELRPTAEIMLAADAIAKALNRVAAAIEVSNRIAGPVATAQSAANTRAPGAGDVAAEGAPAPPLFNTVATVDADERAPAPVFTAEWRVWTRERNAIIRRDYPLDVPTKVIHERLSALPGAPIKRDRIAVQAHKLGVRRSPNWQWTPPQAAESREEVERRIAVARADEPVPPVETIEEPTTVVEVAPAAVEPPAAAVPPPAPVSTPAPVAQPKSRMEALVAVSKAIDARRPSEPAESVPASFEQVRRWAGDRGIPFANWDELPPVNARRERLGLPRFKREFAARGVFG